MCVSLQLTQLEEERKQDLQYIFLTNMWDFDMLCRCLKQKSMFAKFTAAAAAKLLQLCLTLCSPIDSNPPGSRVPGILQARTLEWVAISFSNAWKWKVKVKSLSHIWLLATPWTAAYQAPPSMGFSRQEHWGGMPSSSLLPSTPIPLSFSTPVATWIKIRVSSF